MKKPLLKEQLDQLTCPCGKKTKSLFLHARCHIEAGCDISIGENLVLFICCNICKKPIVEIAVKPIDLKNFQLCSDHDDEYGNEVEYTDDGILHVRCQICKKHIIDVEVERDQND